MTSTNKGHLKYGSIGHNILLITRFYEYEISFTELNTINPTRFKRPSDTKRDILRLVVNGFIIQNGDSWKITNKGVSYLYELASQNRKRVPIDREGI